MAVQVTDTQMKKYIIAILALFVSLSAYAGKTTNELLDSCVNDNSFSQGFCIGYLNGSTSAMKYMPNVMNDLCVPAEVTMGQMQAIFIKWAKNNPQDWHIEADFSIVASLKETYPCKK